MARALATMVFLKAGFVPLVIRDDDHRERYLDALRTADDGDLGPLMSLFANVVSQDLNDAITFVRTMHGRDIKTIAAAAAAAMARRTKQEEARLDALTDHYLHLAEGRFRAISTDLNDAFRMEQELVSRFREASVLMDDGALLEGGRFTEGGSSRWIPQVARTAELHQYSPDLSRFRRWVTLRLPDREIDAARWQIVASFHYKESRSDVMAAVLFLTASRDTMVDDSFGGHPIHPVSRREFSYGTGPEQDERFLAWVEVGLMRALEEWQARI